VDDKHALIGTLLSEAAGLLEYAAGLAPLDDRAGFADRLDRMADHAQNAIALLAAVRVISTMEAKAGGM
jgi:hypothetical protein